MYVAIIGLGSSTVILEDAKQPFTSVTFIIWFPAGAFVFADVPPKLQLYEYEIVPPITVTDTEPSAWPLHKALSEEIAIISRVSGSVIVAFEVAIHPELSVTLIE